MTRPEFQPHLPLQADAVTTEAVLGLISKMSVFFKGQERHSRLSQNKRNEISNRITKSKQAIVCLFVGCLTSQQHASVSQGRICSDNFTCCYTEIGVVDQIFHLIQSQYTDTGPTSPSADSITPGAWQGSHWSANF